MINPFLVRILLFGVLGASLAVAYFSALDWNVRLYVGHGAGSGALLVHLLRLLLIGAAFTLCARQGATALLSSVAGFQILRTVAIAQKGSAVEGKP